MVLTYLPIFLIIIFRSLNDSWKYAMLFLILSILIYFFRQSFLNYEKNKSNDNSKK